MMTMTSNEIRNKEFNSRLRGYDQSEVDSYLSQVSDIVAQLTEENAKLTESNKQLSVRLDEYAQKHDSLNRSILVAQDAADRLKEDAHAEANHLVTEAQEEADRIKKASREKSHELLEHSIQKVYFVQKELEALRQESVHFKKQLHDMLKTYHTVIMDNRWDKVLQMETVKAINLDQMKEAVELAAKLSDSKETDAAPEVTEPSISETKETSTPEASDKTDDGHTEAIDVLEVK